MDSIFALETTALVMLGTAMLGLTCGAVGTIAVLRRQALLGDALAHAALPGVCTAFMIFHQRSFFVLLGGALLFGLISLFSIWCITTFTRLKQDAALGVTLSSYFGLGIVLSRIIQNEPSGNRAGLDDFIFGKAASMATSDVACIVAVGLLAFSFILIFFKELKLLSFDPDFMRTQGFAVKRFDFAVLVLICLCSTAGLPAVGAILVSALLIIPAVSARLLSHRFGIVVMLASCIGAGSALIGTYLSSILPGAPGAQSHGQPTGPLIVLTCCICFAVACAISPQLGIAKFFRGRHGLS